MTDNTNFIKILLSDVEARMGRGMLSPKDFELLSATIEDGLNESVSVSTLKRLWGYSKYTSKPTSNTLSVLCRLVGYLDWEDYQAHRLERSKPVGSGYSTRMTLKMSRLSLAPSVRAASTYSCPLKR